MHRRVHPASVPIKIDGVLAYVSRRRALSWILLRAEGGREGGRGGEGGMWFFVFYEWFFLTLFINQNGRAGVARAHAHSHSLPPSLPITWASQTKLRVLHTTTTYCFAREHAVESDTVRCRNHSRSRRCQTLKCSLYSSHIRKANTAVSSTVSNNHYWVSSFEEIKDQPQECRISTFSTRMLIRIASHIHMILDLERKLIRFR